MIEKDTDKIKVLGFGILLCILLFFIGFISGYRNCFREYNWKDDDGRIDTVFVETQRDSTEHVSKPTADSASNIEYVTIYVPVSPSDSSHLHADSVGVELPLINAYAEVEDTLQVWYHGYVDVGVDSIRYYTHTLTKTIETVKYSNVYITKMPKLALNLGTVGLCDKKCVIGCVYGKLTYTRQKTGFFVYGGYATDFKGDNRPFYGAGVEFTIPILQ